MSAGARRAPGRALRLAIDATSCGRLDTGVGEHVRRLVHALGGIETRHRLTILHAPAGRSLRGGPRGALRFVEVLPPLPLLRPFWRRLGLPPAQLFAGEIDAIHCPAFLPFPALGAPYTLTIHDLTYLLFPRTVEARILRAFTRHLARSAAGAASVIVPSETVREHVATQLGLDRARIQLTPHAVDPAFKPGPGRDSPALAALGVRRPYVLFVGTIEPRKDLPTLLRAFAALRRRGAVPHALVLAGAPGWGTDEARATAAREGLGSEVVWPGYVPRGLLPELYRAADAFVFPSVYEGLGIPPFEALASGTPVLASDAPCLPEVLGDAALYFPVGDAAALASQLERLLHDAALRRDLLSRAARLLGRASDEGLARRTLAILEAAALGRAPPPAG